MRKDDQGDTKALKTTLKKECILFFLEADAVITSCYFSLLRCLNQSQTFIERSQEIICTAWIVSLETWQVSGAALSFHWACVDESMMLIMIYYLKQHETDLLEGLLLPSTKAVAAADNQNPATQRGQLMAYSQWAQKDSHLLPACPKITCIWQHCWYTARTCGWEVFCQGIRVCLSTMEWKRDFYRSLTGCLNIICIARVSLFFYSSVRDILIILQLN